MEKFSVLISVYFREKGEYFAQALASVFEQTVVPDEVVLVEDGFLTDDLYAVIADFKSRYDILKVVRLSQNVGLGEALNQGLSKCSFELVARMDSDDICKRTRFEKQLAVFAKHPNLAVVGSWVDEFEGSVENVVSVRKLPQQSEILKHYATSRSPLNHPSVMFRKSAVDSVGGYKHFYLFEDYYLWARLLQMGYQIFNIQESLLFFRTNPQMMVRRGGWKYAKSEIHLQRQFLNMGLIGYLTFFKNVSIRFIVRMMPNRMRTFVYKKMLRY